VSVTLFAVTFVGALSAVRLDARGSAESENGAPRNEAPKDQPTAQGKKFEYSDKVNDKDTGQPIAGAIVTVRRSLYGDPDVRSEDWVLQETSHKTDEAGRRSAPLRPAEALRLRPEHDLQEREARRTALLRECDPTPDREHYGRH
jgi:hypothetical protein